MRIVGTALLGTVALATAAGVARADGVAILKAQLAALDHKIAVMEQAPELPEGFRLLTISDGALQETPGSPLSARDRAAYAGQATFIGVLPAADRPEGALISWSGYIRAGVVSKSVDDDVHDKAYVLLDGTWVRDPARDVIASQKRDGTTAAGLSQLLVQAKTGTSVGEVGVELEMRVDLAADQYPSLYGKVAWGYWAMTQNLTWGGGYNESLGDLVYGYDGSCTCYFTDNADVEFNPGDTTQLRLDYKSGPIGFAAALESAAIEIMIDPETSASFVDGMLGAAGEITYSGDVFSGEIAGVWRNSDTSETGASEIWQVGLGGSVALGDVATLTFAAATGSGPYEVQSNGTIINELPYENRWWGASAWSSISLSDKTHIELAAGYKHRDGNDATVTSDEGTLEVSGVDYHTYAVMGGFYYTPVDQLTLGIEGEWYTTATTGEAIDTTSNLRYEVDATSDTLWADVVAVWSF